MGFDHHYAVSIEWTGNRGSGTSGYRAYGRDHLVSADGKPSIRGSSDPTFHGDAGNWNPEELLLTALTQCHMLSYLHVAAANGIVVTGYTDSAVGTMTQTADGGGHFVEATLRPVVTVAPGTDLELVHRLHADAARKCFIAASVSFPVHHEARVVVA